MLPTQDTKTIMDSRTVQNMLMKTRIPQKRTFHQRRAHDDEGSDQEVRETRMQTGEDGNLSEGSDVQRPAYKRQNKAGLEYEYDSPVEEMSTVPKVSQEQQA